MVSSLFFRLWQGAEQGGHLENANQLIKFAKRVLSLLTTEINIGLIISLVNERLYYKFND